MLVIRTLKKRRGDRRGQLPAGTDTTKQSQLFGKDQLEEMVTIVKMFIMEKTPPPLTMFRKLVAPGARRPKSKMTGRSVPERAGW